ncbi:MAG TPA: phosphoadenylyl-sulfate reductase [Bacillus bacterium]|nr:phosphoadenylyl-sulfate reductase [Bacillus sp. (in: firmicutes)]
MLTYELCSEEEIQSISFKESLSCLKWAYEQYGDKIVYACSFGAESIVLLHLISKINPSAKITFIDTNLHFKETYEIIEQVKKQYPDFQINFIHTNLSLEEQRKLYGDKLWEVNPNKCCQLRKIEPLKQELQKYKAWVSGMRRSQSETRATIKYINIDHKFKIIKICPLIHWTWDEIWMYIKYHGLPYNKLHDQGYPSIGCEVCTKEVEGEGESRAGRWLNHQKTECGLHIEGD